MGKIAPTLSRLVTPGVVWAPGTDPLMEAQREYRALLAVARAAQAHVRTGSDITEDAVRVALDRLHGRTRCGSLYNGRRCVLGHPHPELAHRQGRALWQTSVEDGRVSRPSRRGAGGRKP